MAGNASSYDYIDELPKLLEELTSFFFVALGVFFLRHIRKV
jgi:hypothetical protein